MESDEETQPALIELQPILEAQKTHGPIFRRELFDAAYAAYLSIKDDDPEEHKYYDNGKPHMLLKSEMTVLDIYGNEKRLPVMREGMIDEEDGQKHIGRRVWMYHDLQDLGVRYSEQNSHGMSLVPFSFGIRHMPVAGEKRCIEYDFHDKVQEWKAEWEGSDLHRELVTFLTKHVGDGTQSIRQIICFGLGAPVSFEHPRAQRRSYVQHLAACTIRDIFARQQGGARPAMFAQDPGYEAIDSSYLTEHFDCTVLDDPDGFKALDGGTFVITVAPNVPVRQIALDLTHDSDGPAGFLCDLIHSNGLEGEGMTRKDCFESDNIVYRTCNPSPALWDYKQRSLRMEYGDSDELDCFGDIGVYLKKHIEA